LPAGTAANDTLTPRAERRRSRAATASPQTAAAARISSLVDVSVPGANHRVPAFREGFVRRPALVRRLTDARDAALALIVAPAGYGKSTLLAEWAERDERPFVWVSLDQRDEEPVTVAAFIAQAFDETEWIEPEVRSGLMSSLAKEPIGGMQRLIRSLSCLDRSFVLVLDDGQTVQAPVLSEVVKAALAELADGSQVALASRVEPLLPIGRMRAHRALVEVRAQDLIMTPTEAATLLRMAGLEVEFEAVQALSRRTEGWPAALYLAALSLRGQDDIAAGMRSFAGNDHLISEYFHDEFLAHLSHDSASFLIRTSVLDRLSGPLCDAVLKQHGSAITLAQLARDNVLLVPLDPNHERFRLHGLFRDTLRAELRQTGPQLEPRLHRRASTWHRGQGDFDRAIDHAVAAGDVERTGDMLWANITGYLANGRNDTVQRWLTSFSSDQIADYAPLALAAAHSSLTLGNLGEAQHWGLAAAEALQRERAAKGTHSLKAGIAIIAATAARVGAVDMGQAATRAYELEPDHSPWRPICCLLSGAAEYLTGHRQSARQRLEEGLQVSDAAPSVASLCLAQLAIMAIDQDDWDTAAEHADQAAKTIQQPGLAAYPTSAMVFAASAATCARQGRADEAKRDFRHAADLLATLGDFIPWYGVQTRMLLAHAALGLADTVGARTLLADASRLARRTSDVVVFQRCFDEAWAYIDTLAETALSGPSSLTIAELRILRFLPSHRSFREIAERLGVSVNTVKTQAHAIYRKLDAASRSEAVARASKAGLLGA
jgi:LuxR family transcriptional regulator, maltose regulon positive regulatory protein